MSCSILLISITNNHKPIDMFQNMHEDLKQQRVAGNQPYRPVLILVFWHGNLAKIPASKYIVRDEKYTDLNKYIEAYVSLR